nr:MAG: hypothetical protein [Bacteriophage sp.]
MHHPIKTTKRGNKMSKSAAKYIRANVSGRIADLCLDVLYTPAIRKNWRNADVLARFLIDTVANAYQCENSTTFADNGYTDMEDAIASYIEANLCDWTQDKFLASSFGKQTAQEITARLIEWYVKNTEFEQRRRAADNDAEFNTRKMRLMIKNGAYDAEHAEALRMNLGIDQAEKLITAMDGQPGAKEAASGFLMRVDANEIDFMVGVADRRSVLMQPCAAARNNAHYYELLVAKRQRKGQVSMTQIDLAYEYILNDAIAGDMVKSADLYHRSILMRDGSWLQLMVSEHNPNIKHGFYVKTQDKLA